MRPLDCSVLNHLSLKFATNQERMVGMETSQERGRRETGPDAHTCFGMSLSGQCQDTRNRTQKWWVGQCPLNLQGSAHSGTVISSGRNTWAPCGKGCAPGGRTGLRVDRKKQGWSALFRLKNNSNMWCPFISRPIED